MNVGRLEHGSTCKLKQFHHPDEEGNVHGDGPTTDTTGCNNEGQILREREALNLDVGQKTQFQDSN